MNQNVINLSYVFCYILLNSQQFLEKIIHFILWSTFMKIYLITIYQKLQIFLKAFEMQNISIG